MFISAVGEVEIVGLRGIFCCQGIDLLHAGQDPALFAVCPYRLHVFSHIPLHHQAGHLEIAEPGLFGLQQQLILQFVQGTYFQQLLLQIKNIPEFYQEPPVNPGQLVDPVYAVAFLKGFLNDQDTHVGRFGKLLIDVLDLHLMVAHESMHALSDHPDPFLNRLFEGPSDGHDFTNRFHTGIDQLGNALKFVQIPARNLAYDIIQCRLEKCRGGFGDGVA